MEKTNQTSCATKFTARFRSGVPRFSAGSKLLQHCETSAATKTSCNKLATATITHRSATATSHPKLHCHRRRCDPWPVRFELRPVSDVAHCQQLQQSPKAHQGAAPPDPTGGATPGLDAMEFGEPLLDAAAPGLLWRGVDGGEPDASGTIAMYSGGWILLEELLNNSAHDIASKPQRICADRKTSFLSNCQS